MYIALEGLDGTGKTTLFHNLVRKKLPECKLQFSTACPTSPGNSSNILERAYRLVPVFRSSSLFRAFLYAYRSYQTSIEADWNSPLVLGDRSIVTSYVTRWRRWMNNPDLSIRFVDTFEPFIKIPDHILFLSLSDSMRFKRLETGREYLEIDETEKRSMEIMAAYDEIRYSAIIPRLEYTIWHDIDASNDPDSVTEHAIKTILTIMGD